MQSAWRQADEPQEVSRGHSTEIDYFQEGPNDNKLLRSRKVGQCEESRKLCKQAIHVRTSWKLCREMEGKFNVAVSSDMEAGIMLARMAVVGTALNVEANLSLIKTPEVNEELLRSARELKDAVK